MGTTHLFIVNGHRVIISEKNSGIGCCYPRIFIEKDKDTHYSIYPTIGAVFCKTLSEFESLIEGKESSESMEFFGEVCKNIGINHEAIIIVINRMNASSKRLDDVCASFAVPKNERESIMEEMYFIRNEINKLKF